MAKRGRKRLVLFMNWQGDKKDCNLGNILSFEVLEFFCFERYNIMQL